MCLVDTMSTVTDRMRKHFVVSETKLSVVIDRKLLNGVSKQMSKHFGESQRQWRYYIVTSVAKGKRVRYTNTSPNYTAKMKEFRSVKPLRRLVT
jgi:hypothetical protein